MSVDLKSLTPDTTLPITGFLFGADSQTAAAPSVYPAVNVIGVPQTAQSVNYTLTLADAGRHILHPAADTTARIITIPGNATVAFPIGTVVTFINAGGTLTIACGDTMYIAGASSVTGSRTLDAYGVAAAIKIDTTTWVISGANLS